MPSRMRWVTRTSPCLPLRRPYGAQRKKAPCLWQRNKGDRPMYAFDYHRPTSVRQAANLAAKAEDAKFLAGGHTLLPTMKQRLAAPANLIDLGQVAELRGIERSARSVTIGAMTRHADVAGSSEIRSAL